MVIIWARRVATTTAVGAFASSSPPWIPPPPDFRGVLGPRLLAPHPVVRGGVFFLVSPRSILWGGIFRRGSVGFSPPPVPSGGSGPALLSHPDVAGELKTVR